MNVVLYSAIYGGYDEVKQVPSGLGVRAMMFTDDYTTGEVAASRGWDVTILGMEDVADTSMMQHKHIKTHPHVWLPSDTDVSLWVDGSFVIYDDYVQRCLAALGEDDWSMITHPARDCIFDEAYFSAQLARYDGPAVIRQAEYYRSIGHPAHWGLVATGANVRRHADVVIETCEQWWYENEHRTHQDQVSLPVLLRLQGDKLRWNTNMPWGEWYGIAPHLK